MGEMKRFVQGESRTQSTLLPELIDDYISESNPVRVIDVFVDELSLGRLGFDGVDPAGTGRPAYHPAVLNRSGFHRGFVVQVQACPARTVRASPENEESRLVFQPQ
jgi:hypothetical protein